MKIKLQRMKKNSEPITSKSGFMKIESPKVESAKRFWKFIVTMGGAGYAPFAPGTAGALVALGIGILIINFTPFPFLLLILLIGSFTLLGIRGSDILEADWGKDPKKIVIDEAVGMWISMLFITNSWIMFLLAFAFFRFFDIVKPLGIRSAENMPGGVGVMADDILAGIYSLILVQCILLILMITLW